MASSNDYYAVLGVPHDAGEQQIRKAFRERVRACHPDRVANLDEDLRRLAAEKMVELNEAYAVLRNPTRRAAYDDDTAHREEHSAADAPRPRAGFGTIEMTRHAAAPHRRRTDPPGSRGRIGEQRFVARAAAEEFQQAVRGSVSGLTSWTPVAIPGATVAMQGARGRSDLYFVLFAAPRTTDRELGRCLRSLVRFGDSLKTSLWKRTRTFGFVAAVEFADRDRQRRTVERFNGGLARRDAVAPATLVDLVNWDAFPGAGGLQSRLDHLLREDHR